MQIITCLLLGKYHLSGDTWRNNDVIIDNDVIIMYVMRQLRSLPDSPVAMAIGLI